MGDRCFCSLSIGGLLKKECIPLLAEQLMDAGCDELASDLNESVDYIADGADYFSFADVNYGTMPSELVNVLRDLKLSYIWKNEAGGEYGAEGLCVNAMTGETGTLSFYGDDVCLTLSEIKKEGAFEEAQRWEAFSTSLKLVVASSNHHILELEKSKELPVGYLEAFSASVQASESESKA